MASAALLTMVASASAADLYAKAPVLPAPVVYNWTGFYIGANAGYAGGDSVLGMNGAPFGFPGMASLTNTSSGFIGGGQIGYNWQTNAILFGLEADIQASNVKSTSGLGALLGGIGGGGLGLGDIGTTIDYFGTVRGRFGVTPWDRSLLYVTGGLAYGQTSTSFLLPLGENTKIGWTVGAGLEYMIAPNWSVKTEYLYVDLGKDDLNLGALAAVGGGVVPPGVSLTEQSRMHVVRAGVNYHF
jgi:outer membrane immunogenic protein